MCSVQVPCLPFLPLLSISINTVLMARLSAAAWLRYLLWMALGKHSHSRGSSSLGVELWWFESPWH